MLDPILFEAFSRCYDPPHSVIEELVENAAYEVRAALRIALDGVTDEMVRSMDADCRAQADVCFRAKTADERLRLSLVSKHIRDCMERVRIVEVAKYPYNSADPYGDPALAGIKVDNEGLVPLSAFQVDGDSLCINGRAFFVMPPVPGPNAAYWLLDQLQRHRLNTNVSVRLNPFLHGPAEKLRGRFYRATIWGRPLDWDRIQNLREPEFGRWTPGRMSLRSIHTDFAWLPHDDEVDFLCEELPIAEEADLRGARYLHAVYDKRHRLITHLDGAIRIYSISDLASRTQKHVRNAGKVGTRIKIFRTDCTVSPDLLSDIAQAFFFWNYDVARYFGAPLPADF